MTTERRKFTRVSSWLYASYVEGTGPTFNTLTNNLSEGGLSLFTEKALNAGTVLKIEVRVSDRKPLHCTAEVIWSEPLTLRGRALPPRAFETGLRFLQVSPEDAKQLMLYAVLSPPPAITA